MSDFLIQVLEAVVMAVVIVCARYAIPWIKNKIGTDNLESATLWAEKAVFYAQQVLTSSTGTEKKETVTAMLKDIFSANGVSISDEQLDILIEAAVKAMKISESSGVVINSTAASEE